MSQTQKGVNTKVVIYSLKSEDKASSNGKTYKEWTIGYMTEEDGMQSAKFSFVSNPTTEKLVAIATKVAPAAKKGSYPCVLQTYLQEGKGSKANGEPYPPQLKLNDILPENTEPLGNTEFTLTTGTTKGGKGGYYQPKDEEAIRVQTCLKVAAQMMVGAKPSVQEISDTTRALYNELEEIIKDVKRAKAAANPSSAAVKDEEDKE